MNTASMTRARRAAVAVLCAATLPLTACVTAGGDGGGGVGVPADATAEQYAEAMADLAPITLTTQSAGTPGHFVSKATEAYAEAIEESSGGKVTVEIVYGNAIAPPGEVNDALADGRLDFNIILPLYDPSRFPANNALADVSFLGEHSPVVGALQNAAGFLDAAYDTPEIFDELEREGIKLLLPYTPTDSVALLCTEPRTGIEEMTGKQTRVSGSVHSGQVETLGMSPVSLEYAEIYQGLQRGTVDCALSSLWTADYGGFLPVASDAVLDTEAGFARIPYGIGFGLDSWESLPLVVRQLLHDRLDVYLEQTLRHSVWGGTAEAVATLSEEGGSIDDFAPDALAALESANAEILKKVRTGDAVADGEQFVRRTTDALEKWLTIVADDLGYTDEVDYAAFDSWYNDGRIDLTGFIDRVRSDVLHKNRPR